MRSTLANTARQIQPQTVGSRLPDTKPKAAKVSLSSPDEQTEANQDIRSATLALIDEARIRAGLKQESMAAFAKVAPGTFSQGLNERHNKSFNASWLDDQPIEFWMALYKLIGLKFNLTSETRRDLILKRAERLLEDIRDILHLTVVSE